MILHRIPGPHGFNLMPIMFCYGCEGLVVPVWATWLAPVMSIMFLVLYWSFPNNYSVLFYFLYVLTKTGTLLVILVWSSQN